MTTTRSASAKASLVMGDGEHRRTQPAEDAAQFDDQPFPERTVELAERFVEHQQPWPWRESAGEGDPLLLTAGEGGDGPLPGAREADQFQQLLDATALFGLRYAVHAQPEGDVARDVALREELVVLEHQADPAPVHRHSGLVGSAEQHPPAVEVLQPGDGP